MRKHWGTWIRLFGAPVFYSTMHWESKHKQLKLIKEKQTNNHNHTKDIAHKDIQKAVHYLKCLTDIPETVCKLNIKIEILIFVYRCKMFVELCTSFPSLNIIFYPKKTNQQF